MGIFIIYNSLPLPFSALPTETRLRCLTPAPDVILLFKWKWTDAAMFKLRARDGIEPCLSPLFFLASVLHLFPAPSDLQTQKGLEVLTSLSPFFYFSNIFMSL